MHSLRLENNDELYRYLQSLSGELKQSGKIEASDRLALASQFAFGFPSEFLHEAMAALALVQTEYKDVLTVAQLAGVGSVIEQIKTAFQRIGGG